MTDMELTSGVDGEILLREGTSVVECTPID